MKKKKVLDIEKQLRQLQDGRLEGGFATLFPGHLNTIVGGATGTNNCNGGNCVPGCGTINTVDRCGHVNSIAGCGPSS